MAIARRDLSPSSMPLPDAVEGINERLQVLSVDDTDNHTSDSGEEEDGPLVEDYDSSDDDNDDFLLLAEDHGVIEQDEESSMDSEGFDWQQYLLRQHDLGFLTRFEQLLVVFAREENDHAQELVEEYRRVLRAPERGIGREELFASVMRNNLLLASLQAQSDEETPLHT
jgi:hypothetical protein